MMHRDVSTLTAHRASGAAFGVRGGGFMMTTIITMTTRFPGASG